jgi:large subunit ribosomal protein L19e
MLKQLKEDGKIDIKTYRKLYSQIKSGAFRNRSHLKLYLKKRGIISEDRA